LVLSLALTARAEDPEFSKFPFDRWLAESRQTQIRWSVIVAPPELSTHQRMILRVAARVDGRELEKRRGSGGLVGLVEYGDGAGKVWRNHASVDAAKLQGALAQQYLDVSFFAFVLPGDYTISLAVCDPKTLEHSVAVRKVHVGGVKNDPLPGSWTQLPAVDVIPGSFDPPDVWYLPGVETRLNLPIKTKRPLHVQLLVNATPTERAAGSAVALRDNMSLLAPALKILTQMRLTNGTIDAAVLDLTHRQVVFEQKNLASLDWAGLRTFFLETKPGIIDVHALADRGKMLGFFGGQVARRLASRNDGAVQVVIVLSGPAFFEDQEPAVAPTEAADPSRQLIYIRYRAYQPPRRYPPGVRVPPGRIGRGGRFPAPPVNLDPDYPVPPMKEDDLEKTAEPMNARVFDAASALQFRRVLAAVVEQLSRM
jgi:hypothetical protein